MFRRVEVWRPIAGMTPSQLHEAKRVVDICGVLNALIDVDEKFIDLDDLVVNAGLNALCSQAFDGSGARLAAFTYGAIGTDGTAPSAAQTGLLAQVMTRIAATYGKDAGVGECSVDITFNIDGTYGLQECGLFNAASGVTMYCRDTYAVKNVVLNDTVKLYYTPKFQVP